MSEGQHMNHRPEPKPVDMRERKDYSSISEGDDLIEKFSVTEAMKVGNLFMQDLQQGRDDAPQQ